MIRRVAFALIVGGLAGSTASAQNPPTTMPPAVVYPTPQAEPPPEIAATPPQVDDPAKVAARRAITRANSPSTRSRPDASTSPTSRRESDSIRGAFANPGGVGRYSEYYTPNTLNPPFDPRRHPAAGFDRGGGPDRASQLAALRVGQARSRNLQDHLNAYGRPYGAYGAGFGLGFGYGYGLTTGRLSGYPR